MFGKVHIPVLPICFCLWAYTELIAEVSGTGIDLSTEPYRRLRFAAVRDTPVRIGIRYLSTEQALPVYVWYVPYTEHTVVWLGGWARAQCVPAVVIH